MRQDLFYQVSIMSGLASYDLSEDLSTLTIDEEEGKADMLTIELSDPFKVFSHAFQEGMEVEVDLGTISDHSLLFRGRIHRVEGGFPQDGVPKLRLQACDSSMAMGLRPRNRPWTDASLREVVESISGVYFRSKDIRLQSERQRGSSGRAEEINPRFTGNGNRQHEMTDLDYLRGLARMYGYQLYVTADEQEDTFHFVAENRIMQGEPDVTLFYGRCDVPYYLISFEASGDISDIRLPMVLSGIEYETGQPIEPMTGPVLEVRNVEDRFLEENRSEFRRQEPHKAARLDGLIGTSSTARMQLLAELGSYRRREVSIFTRPEELRKQVQTHYSTYLQGMSARGSTPGNHRIRAQTSIEIADAGRFSGPWFLYKVQHSLNRQGYQTEFECRR